MPKRCSGARRALLVAATSVVLSSSATVVEAQATFNPGTSGACSDFRLLIDLLLFDFTIDLPDEGWVWIDQRRKIRAATGVARKTRVAASDTPSNHESHDLDFDLLLDPGQEDLLSEVGYDLDGDGVADAIGTEWETGLDPDSDLQGDGADPIFPKWVWPSDGDRVWVEGHWVFDCGHANDDQAEPRYRSEIHPPRALASMRDQAATLPGTGETPVPVTATDLYIHGRGGFVVDQLNCGMDIILGDHGDTCGQTPPPPPNTYRTTPIDVDFSFDVCLPPQPPGGGAFSTRVDPGPRNTVALAPVLTPVPAAGACLGNPRFDQALMMRVDVPLAGTGTPPDAVYARRVYAGWVAPPDPVLPKRRLRLNSMDLHEDHDLDPGDGELTFTWMNLNRAPDSWLRLSDFANGNMNDYDDDFLSGDGEMTFTGARFDFYLRHEHDFSFRARGYEQDCFDTDNNFGNHRLRRLMYVGCYADLPNAGAGDAIADADAAFAAADFGPETVSGGGEYDLRVEIEHLPLANEDSSELSVGSSCAAEGEVALVGSPVSCTTDVDNPGPGLPRQVGLAASVAPGGASAVIEAARWTFADPFGTGPHTCPLGGPSVSSVSCGLGTVPVGGSATVDVTLRPTSPGLLTEVATVTTASTDAQPSDDTASAEIEVFVPVRVDITPGQGRNVMNPRANRTVVVAILSSSDFDATTVDASTTCFGDAEAPHERACHGRPGQDHIRDVDHDGRDDLVLDYALAQTGIDGGDRRACIKGRTTADLGFFGCDSILTMRPNPQPRRPGRGPRTGEQAARGPQTPVDPVRGAPLERR